MDFFPDQAALIIFQLNPSTKAYQRSVYNILDWLGDIGGLFAGLRLIGIALMAPLSGYNLNTFLFSSIFQVSTKEKQESESRSKSVQETCLAA